MSTWHIRPAEHADLVALHPLMAGLQDVERTLHANRSVGAAMAGGHLEYLWQLTTRHDGLLALAVADAQPLGFVVVIIVDEDDGDQHLVPTARRAGIITDLYVEPAARRRGIGAALLASAERHCAARAVSVMRLTTLWANRAARAWYVRRGWQPYELSFEHRVAAAAADDAPERV